MLRYTLGLTRLMYMYPLYLICLDYYSHIPPPLIDIKNVSSFCGRYVPASLSVLPYSADITSTASSDWLTRRL
jgi:hypothetical protein